MIGVQFDVKAWEQALRIPTLNQASKGLAREWKDDAKARLQEKYSGGPMSRYLTSRTGKSRRNVRSRLTSTGAELSISGPGVFLQEYGGTILPKKGTPIKTKAGLKYIPYLRFRLFEPQDTDSATGRWVMARKATIKAKHPARDSAREALASLWLDLGAA